MSAMGSAADIETARESRPAADVGQALGSKGSYCYMKRRTAFSRLAHLTLTPLILAASMGGTLAQRTSTPSYRPLPGRPGRPLPPGGFYGGMNYGPAPGVFIVSAVNTRDSLLQLRDQDGRTADVYVSPRLLDMATLKAGDEVVVDFFVPDDKDDRLEAEH